MAANKNLSKYEQIGFANEVREGYEKLIFEDILLKLGNFSKKNQKILDIGPGCSELPTFIIEYAMKMGSELNLIDSKEMLQNFHQKAGLKKILGQFPYCSKFLEENQQRLDIIICYSVLQYIILDVPFLQFIDSALNLLAPGGQLLIGDIPNISKRKRFLSSAKGIQFHKKYMKTKSNPDTSINKIEFNEIDDSIIFSILHRSRSQGFEAYLLPQNMHLPMANRREDILIVRP